MTIEIDESQRQMMLLALAHLAVERPGWKMALTEAAATMDDRGFFEQFYRIRHDTVRDSLPENPTPETLNAALAKYDNVKQPTKKQIEAALIALMGYHEFMCGNGQRQDDIEAGYLAGFMDGQKRYEDTKV